MRPPSAHPSPLGIIPHFPQQDARQTFGAAVRTNPGLLNAPFLVADPHCAHAPTSMRVLNGEILTVEPLAVFRLGADRNGPAMLTLSVTVTSIHLKSSRLSSGPSAGANHSPAAERIESLFASHLMSRDRDSCGGSTGVRRRIRRRRSLSTTETAVYSRKQVRLFDRARPRYHWLLTGRPRRARKGG
jgi:hypothetical protein